MLRANQGTKWSQVTQFVETGVVCGFRLRKLLLLGALLLLTLLVFLPTIHYELLYDDVYQIVENPRLTSWSYFPGYFTSHLWVHIPELPASYYRPLFLVWLRLLYVTLGPPSPIWHLASVLLHLAVVISVFLLAHRLSKNFNGALAAAALFALHPVNVEAVAWVSATSEQLLTLFLVLCLYCYIERKSPISYLSLLFATLAIFTKETGVVACALILVYEWKQSSFKRAVAATVPYLFPILLYVSARRNALSKAHLGLAADMSLRGMVLTWPRVLWLYAAHLFWPAHLGLFYDVTAESRMWPLLLLLVVVSGAILAILRCGATAQLGAAWFVITLAPALVLPVLHADNYVHDHYLYLPFVGLALMASEWLSKVRWRAPQILAACAVCAACCFVTVSDLPAWKNQLALFTRTVETAPLNPHAKNNLAVTYMDLHREAEAVPLLQQAIELSRPAFYADAYYNLASCYERLGRHEQAIQYAAIWRQFMAQQAAENQK